MKQRADQDATGFPERTGIDPCAADRRALPRTREDRRGQPHATRHGRRKPPDHEWHQHLETSKVRPLKTANAERLTTMTIRRQKR